MTICQLGCARPSDHLQRPVEPSAAGSGALAADRARAEGEIQILPQVEGTTQSPTGRTKTRAASITSTRSEDAGGNVVEVQTYSADGSGSPPQGSPCATKIVEILRRSSPTGFAIWNAAADKSLFNTFVGDCEDRDATFRTGLTTAVHEYSHYLRTISRAYHLVAGERIAVPPMPDFFPPKLAAPSLLQRVSAAREDDYFNDYLRGKTEYSSNTDFSYLLDELNAYTVDLQASVDLADRKVFNVVELDGVPALMAFTAQYAEYAKANAPKTWAQLTGPTAVHAVVIKLWSQAESTLERACAHGVEYKDKVGYVRLLCDVPESHAMRDVLGSAPRCPKLCQ